MSFLEVIIIWADFGGRSFNEDIISQFAVTLKGC